MYVVDATDRKLKKLAAYCFILGETGYCFMIEKLWKLANATWQKFRNWILLRDRETVEIG
jgi:hypothetical protein